MAQSDRTLLARELYVRHWFLPSFADGLPDVSFKVGCWLQRIEEHVEAARVISNQASHSWQLLFGNDHEWILLQVLLHTVKLARLLEIEHGSRRKLRFKVEHLLLLFQNSWWHDRCMSEQIRRYLIVLELLRQLKLAN